MTAARCVADDLPVISNKILAESAGNPKTRATLKRTDEIEMEVVKDGCVPMVSRSYRKSWKEPCSRK